MCNLMAMKATVDKRDILPYIILLTADSTNLVEIYGETYSRIDQGKKAMLF